MSFKPYQSKPITRMAHEISVDDVVLRVEENIFRLRTPAGEQYEFVAHSPVMPGDYVVYLNDKDIYHCSREVFHERNIIPELQTEEEIA